MEIEKQLQKIGIIPKGKLKIEDKNNIAKTIAEKLSANIPELSNSYNELYMRIFNCNIYYAEVDKKFCGVFYYYKNNTIYLEKIDDLDASPYFVHEIIHYLQNFEKINKKSNRAGICKFTDFKIFGLGINEAIVQYFAAKAIGNTVHKIKNDNITIYTNNENNYKYLTSLAYQIMLLIGEEEAIKSCISSTDDFENKLYNTFEENTDKILKNFDNILNENNKKARDENKIINIYLQTQKIIYTTYFTKMYNQVTTIKEVDEQVEKIENYQKILGKINNGKMTEEDEFNIFKDKMNSKFLEKYMEINRRKTRNSLVVYKKSIASIFNRISKFIQEKLKSKKT